MGPMVIGLWRQINVSIHLRYNVLHIRKKLVWENPFISIVCLEGKPPFSEICTLYSRVSASRLSGCLLDSLVHEKCLILGKKTCMCFLINTNSK